MIPATEPRTDTATMDAAVPPVARPTGLLTLSTWRRFEPRAANLVCTALHCGTTAGVAVCSAEANTTGEAGSTSASGEKTVTVLGTASGGCLVTDGLQDVSWRPCAGAGNPGWDLSRSVVSQPVASSGVLMVGCETSGRRDWTWGS